MKVLHVLNELKPSGAETMLLSAYAGWAPHSEQHILSTGESEGEFAPALRDAGYTIHHLPFAKSRAFFLGFGDFVRDGGYDVLHLHPERASLWYALAARLRCASGLRIVRTVHHIFFFEGFFRIRRMLERQFTKYALRVVFLSNSPSGQRNELRRFHMSNDLAPNWYDSSRFTPPTDDQRRQARSALGLHDNLTVFVSLGGNWAYKNYDMVVRALAQIPPEHELLYIQIGVQGENQPLETLAETLGVSARLRCAGVVGDALPYLHAADAYLMPSSEEGFGVAAVEAMACGLPAVLSDVAALCDFRENISGIRYIQPEVHEIAEAMETFAKMPSPQRRELGLQQARDVETHYGLNVGPRAYLKAWQH